MYQIDFNKLEHVHLIGVEDISVNDPAEILLDEGFLVSGSDPHKTALTEHLETRGTRVYYGQRAADIGREPGISIMVYAIAVHEDNPEFRAAGDQELPMLSGAEPLRELMRDYEEIIAILGIHGETTTTSMLVSILLAGDLDPTISVGSILEDIGDNIHADGSDLFMIGAYEYTNSFLSFYPTMEVILNAEEDHLDFFRGIEDIRHPFHLFVEKLLARGLLMVDNGVEKVEEITRGFRCRMVTFGKDFSSTYMARNITHDGFVRPSYDLVVQGRTVTRITLGVTGEHNVCDFLAAIVIALELGVGFDAIMSRLGRFTGTDRQPEKEGEVADAMVIDDYAHHPQEIKTTLAAVKNCPHRKLWCVFQPHVYTRIRAFPDRFAEILSAAGEAVLADIYVARETDIPGVSSRGMVDRVGELGTKAHYIPFFNGTETFILENYMNGDLLVAMRVGDIVKAEEKLLEQ